MRLPRRLPLHAGLLALAASGVGPAGAERLGGLGLSTPRLGSKSSPAVPAFRSGPAPLLPAEAFTAAPVCALDPFEASNTQPQAEPRPCGGERLHVALAPDGAAADKTYAIEVDQRVAYRLDALTTSARLGWTGAGDPAGLRSPGRALLAAGASWRLGDAAALDLQLGREQAEDDIRTRAVASGRWRPWGDNLLFVGLSAEVSHLAPLAGLRWWVVPGRLALSLSARARPGADALEPRLGLTVFEWER